MATEDARPPYDDLAETLRIVFDELRRTVDEDGRIIHQNRVNYIYGLLPRVYGADYWEKHQINDEAPKIVMRHISGD
jgi:hypothetical protein